MKRSGEEQSPAQRLRDQRAAAAWRQKLGPEASGLTDSELKVAAFSAILTRIANKPRPKIGAAQPAGKKKAKRGKQTRSR